MTAKWTVARAAVPASSTIAAASSSRSDGGVACNVLVEGGRFQTSSIATAHSMASTAMSATVDRTPAATIGPQGSEAAPVNTAAAAAMSATRSAPRAALRAKRTAAAMGSDSPAIPPITAGRVDRDRTRRRRRERA